jgi:putative oxidoreductase
MNKNLPLLFIRIIGGIVFLTEGILKFVYPDEFGSGRFAHIGLPMPHVLAPFVAGVEIAAGAALVLNAYVGAAAVLLLCVIVTAIVSTKIPVLLGHNVGTFSVPKNTAHTGFLGFIHEARTDLAMLFSLIAILLDSRGISLGRSASRPKR